VAETAHVTGRPRRPGLTVIETEIRTENATGIVSVTAEIKTMTAQGVIGTNQKRNEMVTVSGIRTNIQAENADETVTETKRRKAMMRFPASVGEKR